MKRITKPVGLWMDFRHAYIVMINDNNTVTTEVSSFIDEGHAVGGSGSATPYGPQDAVSEPRHLKRRLQQEKRYYQSILEHIHDRDGIYIMGPGQAKLGLESEIRENHEKIDYLLDVETCGRLTHNQVKAKVKDYFHLLGASDPARRY
ncbi:MAG: hypothetical protein OER04_00750 [Cyclobacteriaceae bacterium]|nr:hypothetical protein [Cyclobacteriaceae bacterium]